VDTIAIRQRLREFRNGLRGIRRILYYLVVHAAFGSHVQEVAALESESNLWRTLMQFLSECACAQERSERESQT